MVVGGADDRVIDLEMRSQPLTDGDHIVMEKPDGVEGHDSKAGIAIVDHACDRPKVVMDGGGGPFLAKARQPNGAARAREVRVDLHPGEAGCERFGIRGRRAAVNRHRNLVSGIAITKPVQAEPAQGDPPPGPEPEDQAQEPPQE